MPLGPPAPRDAIHHRTIDCRGYRRADGLWDIEGHLVDTKGYPFDNRFRGTIPPGTPLHDMALRLTVTDDLEIVAVEAVTDTGPYRACPAITPNFQRLVGLQIGKGWRRAVAARLGGVEGCTHLVELLAPLATAAIQTIWPIRAREVEARGERASDPNTPPPLLDSCHVYDRGGPVVAEQWPEWSTRPTRDG